MTTKYEDLETNEKEGELIKKMNEKNQTKNTVKGITLIALVITIIILLILAGVSIIGLTRR